MDAHEVIRSSLRTTDMLWKGYIEDLSDSDLLVRPVPGANHIAWQLGHLICSEHGMVEATCPGSMPELPAGFADKYRKETSSLDDASAFHAKRQYLDLFEQQRAGTLRALEGLTAEQLDGPAPESMRSYADTVGAVFLMQSTHWLMHAGQWAVIRRKLDRPPLF